MLENSLKTLKYYTKTILYHQIHLILYTQKCIMIPTEYFWHMVFIKVASKYSQYDNPS